MRLVTSPMIARGFSSLFPVGGFEEVKEEGSSKRVKTEEPVKEDSAAQAMKCAGCDKLFPSLYANLPGSGAGGKKRILLLSSSSYRASVSEGGERPSAKAARNSDVVQTMKFQCPKCREVFCFDCDSFIHEELHNCPGCL